MAEADLGPSELDLIEDALEELELDGALDRFAANEHDPRVHARLVDYRSVLAAAREALPLEDVPAGVLDGVMAQARQAATVPGAAAAAVHEPWWTRLRRTFMVPVLALAGTAALVLWVFDPKDQATLTDPPAASGAKAGEPADTKREAPRSEAGEREQAEATPAAPTTATSAVDAAAAPKDAPVPDAQEALQGVLEGEAKLGADEEAVVEPAKPTEDVGRRAKGDAPGAMGGVMPVQPPAQTKSGGAGSAAGRWDLVNRGDRSRQAGDCVAAREDYAVALEDDEPGVRARAFAGLGLCDAVAGDEASADANYEKARELDDAVAKFIESQSERRSTGKKSKPTRKSKVSADAYDGVNDPF